ncbi:hypothetical protein GCM10022196_15140 [Aeromicrobium flavum]
MHEYVAVLLRRWKTFLVWLLLGGSLGWGAAVAIPTEYTASTSLFVSSSGADPMQDYQGGLLAQQRVKSYALLVTSAPVLDELAKERGESVEMLAERITATAELESVLLTIAATEATAQGAKELAAGVAARFIDYQADLETARGDGPGTLDVRVGAPAVVPSSPSSLSLATLVGVGLVLGAAAGVAGALLRDRRDTRVTPSRLARAALPMPLVGVLPKERHSRGPRMPWDSLPPGDSRREAVLFMGSALEHLSRSSSPVVVLTPAGVDVSMAPTVTDVAQALASRGHRVLLLVGPRQSGALARALGVETVPDQPSGSEGRPWSDGVVSVAERIDVRFATNEATAGLADGAALERFIADARQSHDIVLVCAPAVTGSAEVAEVALVADLTVVLARHGSTRAEEVHRAVGALGRLGVERVALGVVAVPPSSLDDYEFSPTAG